MPTATSIVPTCAELNPIVGRCGERVPLAVYVPVGFALHAAVAWMLPPRWRDVFQGLTVATEALAIGLNASTRAARDRRAPTCDRRANPRHAGDASGRLVGSSRDPR